MQHNGLISTINDMFFHLCVITSFFKLNNAYNSDNFWSLSAGLSCKFETQDNLAILGLDVAYI